MHKSKPRKVKIKSKHYKQSQVIARSLRGYSHREHCRAPNVAQMINKRESQNLRLQQITSDCSQPRGLLTSGVLPRSNTARKNKGIPYLLSHVIKKFGLIFSREILPF